MVTLEDTWAETRPQNRPGTSGDSPNWRGKHRYSLEELPRTPAFQQLAGLMSVRGGRR
jgi:4-alpha-glucanotransferase